jgi:hypothetical protein
VFRPERSKTERGRESPGLALLAVAHTDIWLEREDLGMSLLLCPGKMFRQGNYNALSFPMAYSALLNNVFEPLNLLLIILLYLCIRNSATWQWQWAPLQNTEIWLEFITSSEVQMLYTPAACVDSSLQLSISAKTTLTASHFKLPSQ